ncbi:unnamed protein product [Scytosiphon promiscuus]
MDVLDHNVAAGETFWGRVFDAQSQHPASKKVDFPVKHEFVAWEYTRHDDGGNLAGAKSTDGVEVLSSGAIRIRQKAMFSKGLSSTRFHMGFQRRNQSQIRQDEARLQREASKQHQSWLHVQRRRQRLGSLDKRNGFNIITGHFNPKCRCTTPFHVQPKTRESCSLSAVAERAEYLILRESQYKFHSPAWSGKNHDERQDLLRREGLNKPKKSTLLGIGGAHLASVGAEDMFSKAIYEPSRACAVEGLVEKSIPGRFTPRKVAAARKKAAVAEVAPAAIAMPTRGESPPQRGGHDTSSDGDGQRNALSPFPVDTVFRVVPNGLGHHSTLAGRGGAAVAGIAPPKRLQGSRSTPILRKVQRQVEERTGTPVSNPDLVQSPNPEGGTGTGTFTGTTADGEGSKVLSDEALGPSNMKTEDVSNRCNTRRDRGSERSRKLSRSISDFARSGGEEKIQGKEKVGTAGEEVIVGENASWTSRAQHFVGGSVEGRLRSPSSPWRGATPTERRRHDQLALDLATVRSL